MSWSLPVVVLCVFSARGKLSFVHGMGFAYMVVTRGLSLLRAWWAAGLKVCPWVIATMCCCHQVAGAVSVVWLSRGCDGSGMVVC